MAEILIFGIWYQFIYNHSNKSIFWLLRKSIRYGVLWIFQNEFYTMLYVLGMPVVISLFMYEVDDHLMKIIWGIVGIGIFVENLFKYRIELSESLNTYIRFLHDCQKGNALIVEPEENLKVALDGENVIEKEIDWYAIDKIRCNLKIEQVYIVVENTSGKIAYSSYDKDYGEYVSLGLQKLNWLGKNFDEYEYQEIIKFIFGHEFTHLAHKDYSERRLLLKILLINAITLFFICNCIMLLEVVKSESLYWLLGSFEIVVFIGVTTIIWNKRYWKLVMEFRADRIGLKVSGVSVSTFQKFMLSFAESENKKEKDNFLSKFYKRYIQENIHPSIQRRLYEVERGKEWNLGEYFRYLWIIGIRVFIGKGWEI